MSKLVSEPTVEMVEPLSAMLSARKAEPAPAWSMANNGVAVDALKAAAPENVCAPVTVKLPVISTSPSVTMLPYLSTVKWPELILMVFPLKLAGRLKVWPKEKLGRSESNCLRIRSTRSLVS